MNQLFNYKGHEIRTITIEGEPWFVLKDLCDVLEIDHVPTVRQRLDDDMVTNHTVKDALGRANRANIVNEAGMYEVIFDSRKPEARAFRRWVTTEVLPAIRKNKVYIDPTATDQEIDNAIKFATPQKRRKALMEATIDGASSVFTTYEDIKHYISKWTAEQKITALEHVERVLKDKQLTYGNDVAFIHKIEQLLNTVAKDLDKVKNWKNGAIKRELTKENKQLQDEIEFLNPSLDKFHIINVHGFSENYMYDSIIEFGNGQFTKLKSKAYMDWLIKFPRHRLPKLRELYKWH